MWENIIVSFIVILAAYFAGRRLWRKFNRVRDGDPACSGNCNKCALEKFPKEEQP